jgi:hypothetical protein
MKKIIYLFLFLLFGFNILYSQTAKLIDSREEWTATGVIINTDESVTIFAQGYASWHSSGISENILDWYGPNGISGVYLNTTNSPCPTCPGMSLIGKIGVNGQPFYVGSLCHIGDEITGELYLGINDELTSDNYGYYVALLLKNFTPTAINGNIETPNIQYELAQNFPNPFNPSTTIEYSVQTTDNIQIKIYNSLGQLVTTLLNETKTPGEYSILWNGKDDSNFLVSSGAYFYQIQTNVMLQLESYFYGVKLV